MASAISPDLLMERMKAWVSDLDHLIQPVTDSLLAEVERVIKLDREAKVRVGPLITRREAFLQAFRNEAAGYQHDGATGRLFVLEQIEAQLREDWQAADDGDASDLAHHAARLAVFDGDDSDLANLARLYIQADSESASTGEGAYAVYERNGVIREMESYLENIIEERMKHADG